MERLIQMIINQVLRHFVKRGVDSGLNRLSGKPGQAPQPRDAKDIARKARQAANLARRMGR